MHIFLRRPQKELLARYVAKYQKDLVTCLNPGSTRDWTLDMFEELPTSKLVRGDLWKFRRAAVGQGLEQFEIGKVALTQGLCFDLTWVDCFTSRPFETGDVFSLYTQAFGLWSVNFCRIVYLEEIEDEKGKVFSLGIGTLPRHAAIGEERLSMVWDRTSQRVDFLIGSYSRPATMISRVFASYLRKRQDVFAVDAAKRIVAQISEQT